MRHIKKLLKVSIFRKVHFCQNLSTHAQVIQLEKCKPNSGTPCIMTSFPDTSNLQMRAHMSSLKTSKWNCWLNLMDSLKSSLKYIVDRRRLIEARDYFQVSTGWRITFFQGSTAWTRNAAHAHSTFPERKFDSRSNETIILKIRSQIKKLSAEVRD